MRNALLCAALTPGLFGLLIGPLHCLVGSLQKAVLAAAINKAPLLFTSVEAEYELDPFPRLHQLHWLRPSCPRACAILKVLCDHTAVC